MRKNYQINQFATHPSKNDFSTLILLSHFSNSFCIIFILLFQILIVFQVCFIFSSSLSIFFTILEYFCSFLRSFAVIYIILSCSLFGMFLQPCFRNKTKDQLGPMSLDRIICKELLYRGFLQIDFLRLYTLELESTHWQSAPANSPSLAPWVTPFPDWPLGCVPSPNGSLWLGSLVWSLIVRMNILLLLVISEGNITEKKFTTGFK